MSASPPTSSPGTYASAARGVAASRSPSPLKQDASSDPVPAAIAEDAAEASGGSASVGGSTSEDPLTASQSSLDLRTAESSTTSLDVPASGSASDDENAKEVVAATEDDGYPDVEADTSFELHGAIDTDHALPSFALPDSQRAPVVIESLDSPELVMDGSDIPDDDGWNEGIHQPVAPGEVVPSPYQWGEIIEGPVPPGMEAFPKLPSRSDAAKAAAAAAEARLAGLSRVDEEGNLIPADPSSLSEAPLPSRWHTDVKPTFMVPDLSPRVSKASLIAVLAPTANESAAETASTPASASSDASPKDAAASEAHEPSWASDVGSKFADEVPGEIIGLEPELSKSNSTPWGGRSGVSRWQGISMSPLDIEDTQYRASQVDDYGWGNSQGRETPAGPPQASQSYVQPQLQYQQARAPAVAVSQPYSRSNEFQYTPGMHVQQQIPSFAPAVPNQPFNAFPDHAPISAVDPLGPRPTPVHALPSAWASPRDIPSPVPSPSVSSGIDQSGRLKAKAALIIDDDAEVSVGAAENVEEQGGGEGLVTIQIPTSAAISTPTAAWAASQWRSDPNAQNDKSSANHSTNYSNGIHTENQMSAYSHANGDGDGDGYDQQRVVLNPRAREFRSPSPLVKYNGNGSINGPGRQNRSARANGNGNGTNATSGLGGVHAVAAHFPNFGQVDADGWTIASPGVTGTNSGSRSVSASSAGGGGRGGGGGGGGGNRRKGRGGRGGRETWEQQLAKDRRTREEQQRLAEDALRQREAVKRRVPGATTRVPEVQAAAVLADEDDPYGGW